MNDEEFLDWLDALVESSGAARMNLAVEHRRRLYAISGGELAPDITDPIRGYIKRNVAEARQIIINRVAKKLLG